LIVFANAKSVRIGQFIAAQMYAATAQAAALIIHNLNAFRIGPKAKVNSKCPSE